MGTLTGFGICGNGALDLITPDNNNNNNNRKTLSRRPSEMLEWVLLRTLRHEWMEKQKNADAETQTRQHRGLLANRFVYRCQLRLPSIGYNYFDRFPSTPLIQQQL
ncbi:hypothetical protein M0804_005534 [Polistes exclamans]|nr:hypothetical protein M0804_005534 [Polistes exclamans]